MSRRLIALFALVLLLVLALAWVVWKSIDAAEDSARLVAHSVQVRESLASIKEDFHAATAAQRGYLLTGRTSFLGDYYRALTPLQVLFDELDSQLSGHAGQTERAQQLRELIELRIAQMNEAIELLRETDPSSIPRLLVQDERLHVEQELRRLGAQIETVEQERLATLQRASRASAANSKQIALTAILTSALALLSALWVIGREQHRSVRSQLEIRSSHERLQDSLEQSRSMAGDLHALTQFGERLQSCRDLDEILTATRIASLRLLPGCDGAVFLLNASKNLIELAVSWGEPPRGEPVFAPESCWSLRSGQIYDCLPGQPQQRCPHLSDRNEVVTDAPPAGSRCIPLSAQGESLGILHLRLLNTPSKREDELAQALGKQLSLAVANQNLNTTLRSQSIRDPLTGLFNRRYLEASFVRELDRASRRQLPLSLMMLDVDHFKRFNDEHGHDAGDRVLQAFGELLLRLSRKEDIACRYGGEEFALILPEIDAKSALTRANELRAQLSQLHLFHHSRPLPGVTASIGIACFPDHGERPGELIARADAALFQAKRAGRDRAVLA